jgi:hypothetical protein
MKIALGEIPTNKNGNLAEPSPMGLIPLQFSFRKYSRVRLNVQFEKQNCPFRRTLAGILTPTPSYQPVRLNALYCKKIQL